MIQYLVGGFVGAVILGLSCIAAHARIVLGQARLDREEALKLAQQAMDAKQAAEEGFSQAKKYFEDRMKIPVVVNISEEQIALLGNKLAAKLFDAGRAVHGTPS